MQRWRWGIPQLPLAAFITLITHDRLIINGD